MAADASSSMDMGVPVGKGVAGNVNNKAGTPGDQSYQGRVARAKANVANWSAQRIHEQLAPQDGLRALARETGALFIRGTNDLNLGIQYVLNDQAGYYLIGFKPAEKSFTSLDGGPRFNKLRIRVNRPGLDVRYRQGYFGVQPVPVMSDLEIRELQLLNALANPLRVNELGLKLEHVWVKEGRNYRVSCQARLDSRLVQFVSRGEADHDAELDLMWILLDKKGKVVHFQDSKYLMTFTGEKFDTIRKDGLILNFDVPVEKKGEYQARLSVRDSVSERVAMATSYINLRKK
jgi:hypothetical protein